MEFRMNLRTRLRIDRGTHMNRCVIKHLEQNINCGIQEVDEW